MKKIILILALVILILSLMIDYSVVSEKLEYDAISYRGDTLGIFVVSKEKNKKETIYTYNTDMKVNFIIETHIQISLKAIYNSKQMLSATVDNSVNGRKNQTTDINWMGNYYLIDTDEKKQVKHYSPIYYSSIKLFFDEPIDVHKVFSEKIAEYGIVRLIGENTYEHTTPNGKKNKYFYQNGVLVKAEINGIMLAFKLILKNNQMVQNLK